MTIAFISQKVQKVFSGKPVRKAYVFGSVARNEQSLLSDLDILVELDSTKTIGLIEYIKIQQELELVFKIPVDMVTTDGLSPHIKPFIDREKKQIYEA